MKLAQSKLVTVVAEDELEERLVRELKACGATGYTITKARGEGTFRVRTSEWEGENIRIEALVDEAVADRIVEGLARKYLEKFGLIFYCTTVEVLRGEKFAASPPPPRPG